MLSDIFAGVEILMTGYLLSHLKILKKIFSASFGFLILVAVFLRFVFNQSLQGQVVGIFVLLVDIIYMAFLSFIVLTIHKFKKEKS